MIYLGNSLPVRQWDLAATIENKSFEILATRGVNGIDGQISTFFGLQKMGQEAWAIIGDLTALYDLQGPWIVEQLKNFGFKIIIINNSGGQIFNRMFGKREFLNEHSLSFDSMAAMWGLSYEKVYDLNQSDLKSSIIEICPEPSSSKRFWDEYKKI
jgi:2-succinyl-5-enolpyruvyl-6-hydroxy-3-cyclohexene-1-carboxylate synthase